MAIYKAYFVMCGVIFFLVVAGCATTDQKRSLQHQPVVDAKGATGELYLAVSAKKPIVHDRVTKTIGGHLFANSERPKVRYRDGLASEREGVTDKWVIVTEKNHDQKKLGITVSPLITDEVLQDALSQELNAAGYTVKLVNRLPKNVERGIDLSRVSLDVEQVTGLFEVEGACKVNISLALLRKGAKVKKLSYEARFSESSSYDRNQFLHTVVTGALQTLMKKAVPDIIRELGNR